MSEAPKKTAKPRAPKKPAANAQPASYEVVTDRRPYWGGKPRPKGYIILNPETNPAAIWAMLEREWIKANTNETTP